MPFNGSGVFTRVYNWQNDANAGINITASRVDTEDSGFATGLSNVICRDGQSTVTADLPMSGFKNLNVANAVLRNQYAAAGQLQDGVINWVAAAGTSDVITATYVPAITSLVDGQLFGIRASAANTTTTPTFSPNGQTARTITKLGGSALAVNDIAAAGHQLLLRYDLANTRYELLNPGVTISSASTSAAGIVQLATVTEAKTGTNTTKAVTSDGLAAAKGQIAQNSQSADYTLILLDAGKHIYHPSADTTTRTWTIPANASVAFDIGSAVTFINDTSGGAITIAITSDTLVLAGLGTTGSRTLAANGIATAIKVTATRWQINGTGLT